MKSIVTAADMRLTDRIFRFVSPDDIPISFTFAGRKINGLPADFAPVSEVVRIDANIRHTVVRGEHNGLQVRVEYTEYLDYPATELVAYFTNASDSALPRISDIMIADGVIPCGEAVLVHGNGDTLKRDGYEWFSDAIGDRLELSPTDGTPCNGAFPYMRLQAEGFGVNIAVGWPAMWKAYFEKADGGVKLAFGQKRCDMVIMPGETMRTPKMTFVAYTGDGERGTNMWRRWYFDHVLPRENGRQLPPKLCMHVFGAGGHPEFTGADEQNQVGGIEDYVRRGVKPDIWWVDAGWYPCDYDWTRTGSWVPDPVRFPNGLAPLGQKCEAEGMQLMLWFEPERVRAGSMLHTEHPEWLLKRVVPAEGDDKNTILNLDHRDHLLNLGNRECCDWLIEHVDSLIKRSHVHIYRQDFNFDPKPYWEQNETDDRIGALENLHVQGYLRYWDALIDRNPGLWIDSCASGGRRNDIETMRRAVPLHYTDVGYGDHPIKQKQHHQMFGWIPYFRAHNLNWDDPATGEYNQKGRPQDRYSYYVAMTPALTDMLEHDAAEEDFALAREMQPIWRRAAEMMLACDYYPLTDRNVTQEDVYAVQFHDPDNGRGFVEIVANNRCNLDKYTARLRGVEAGDMYVLAEAETGSQREHTGTELLGGVDFAIAPREGHIYFYERKTMR